MNKAIFSKYTEKIRVALPFWFNMKRKPNNSVGLDFLSVFGMQLDDIEKILDYALDQYFIETADIDTVDVVYKVNLPSHFKMKNITGVSSEYDTLKVVDTLYDFFGIEDRINKLNHSIEQNNICFIDVANKVIFVREPYCKSKVRPYGYIYVHHGEDDVSEFDLTIHHVWNFFDEFGALLGCPRLKGEKNYKYKERILDVFKNPANSTKTGLANGIARELGLREIRIWGDMSNDFIIQDRMVIADSIQVNREFVDEVYVNDEGYLVLLGVDGKENISAEVTYIKGFSIEPLIDKDINTGLSNELVNSDGTPTDKMKGYVDYIRGQGASILWGDFIYDEAIWIKDEEDYYTNHFSFLPTILDAKIGGFESYGFVE